MRTVQTTVYNFEELSDKAKEKARDWYREHALDYEWWDSTYEDAARIGLRITGFDLDRNRHATGEFNCLGQGEQCANAILAEHGEKCETFKTAKQYLADLTKLNKECAAAGGDDEASADYDLWFDKRGELEQEFLQSLLEDYSIMLQHECEYLLSDEAVDESIIANEYTFTETGKRFA